MVVYSFICVLSIILQVIHKLANRDPTHKSITHIHTCTTVSTLHFWQKVKHVEWRYVIHFHFLPTRSTSSPKIQMPNVRHNWRQSGRNSQLSQCRAVLKHYSLQVPASQLMERLLMQQWVPRTLLCTITHVRMIYDWTQHNVA